MQVFSQIRTVKEEDLDELQHMNNVRYVQWIQDIAKSHWEQNTTAHLRSTYFWVVRNHTIDYKAEAKLSDAIKIETYVIDSKGYMSTRNVKMTNLNSNKVILKATTLWVLMNATTRLPEKLTEELINLFD